MEPVEVGDAVDALDEVNATRAAAGLPPFIRDDALVIAAKGVTRFRAARLLHGHANDFSFLPAGASASAAGAEGDSYFPPSIGWHTCCTYESYTYAGAAYTIGRDGSRYMSLFVRR